MRIPSIRFVLLICVALALVGCDGDDNGIAQVIKDAIAASKGVLDEDESGDNPVDPAYGATGCCTFVGVKCPFFPPGGPVGWSCYCTPDGYRYYDGLSC